MLKTEEQHCTIGTCTTQVECPCACAGCHLAIARSRRSIEEAMRAVENPTFRPATGHPSASAWVPKRKA